MEFTLIHILNELMATSRIFWSKIHTFNFIHISKNLHDSCDYFHVQIMAVGGRYVGATWGKLIKKLQLFSDAIES